MHSYGGLLVPRGPKLALLKSTFNAENFIRRLYWSISSDSTQFSLEISVAAQNREKIISNDSNLIVRMLSRNASLHNFVTFNI